MADTKRIEVRGVPEALLNAITKRAEALGMSRSAYIQHVAALDCAQAGLWMPAGPAVRGGTLPHWTPEPLLDFARTMSKAGGEMMAAIEDSMFKTGRPLAGDGEPVHSANTLLGAEWSDANRTGVGGMPDPESDGCPGFPKGVA